MHLLLQWKKWWKFLKLSRRLLTCSSLHEDHPVKKPKIPESHVAGIHWSEVHISQWSTVGGQKRQNREIIKYKNNIPPKRFKPYATQMYLNSLTFICYGKLSFTIIYPQKTYRKPYNIISCAVGTGNWPVVWGVLYSWRCHSTGPWPAPHTSVQCDPSYPGCWFCRDHITQQSLAPLHVPA